MIRVFCDGSCLGNGQQGARAGYGVWFDGIGLAAISRRLMSKPTNQRAELLAAIVAIEKISMFHELVGVEVYTDSMYVYKIITSWLVGWKARGWRRVGNKPILNIDLIKRLDRVLINNTNKIKWVHVRSHQPEPSDKSSLNWIVWRGNKKADELAVRGARLVRD